MTNLKCVMCGEDAEYIQAGLSLCKKHFKWAIDVVQKEGIKKN